MPARASVKQRTRRKSGGLKKFEKDRRKAIRSGKDRVKIGLPASAADYPDGTSVIMVGVVHEFGSEDGTIPERSWLRSAMRENKEKHRKFIKRLAKRVSAGSLAVDKALDLLGTRVVNDVKNQIVAVIDPPNTPETIRRKGGKTNPLINTGHLRLQVTHQVVGKGK